MKPAPIISASEIGEYVYCKRAWWLRYRGLLSETEKMREGTRQHEMLSDALERNHKRMLLAWSLVIAGILLLLGLVALVVLQGVRLPE